MANVIVCGSTYECAIAYKGPDYVRLVDSTGKLVASFEGVTDFSIFAISNGDWTNLSCHKVASTGFMYGTELPATGVEGQVFFKV